MSDSVARRSLPERGSVACGKSDSSGAAFGGHRATAGDLSTSDGPHRQTVGQMGLHVGPGPKALVKSARSGRHSVIVSDHTRPNRGWKRGGLAPCLRRRFPRRFGGKPKLTGITEFSDEQTKQVTDPVGLRRRGCHREQPLPRSLGKIGSLYRSGLKLRMGAPHEGVKVSLCPCGRRELRRRYGGRFFGGFGLRRIDHRPHLRSQLRRANNTYRLKTSILLPGAAAGG